MNSLFLQSLSFSDITSLGTNFSELFAGLLIFVIIGIVIIFGLYVYLSLAYSKIGEKSRLNSPGIAWMPGYGVTAVIFESSKMHWWPFLALVVGGILGILVSGFGQIVPASAILFLTMLLFAVMNIIWHWKTYEGIGKPGWWTLIPIISIIIGMVLAYYITPLIGGIIAILGMLSHFVLIGMAAWSATVAENTEQTSQEQEDTSQQTIS